MSLPVPCAPWIIGTKGDHDSLQRFERFYARVRQLGVLPLTAGGDHLVSLPVLRGLKDGAPLAMIHFDSHTDLFKDYFDGARFTHGTPFRRAIEEGLLDPTRVVQIGIRGTTYDGEDREFARSAGVRVIPIEELFSRGIPDVMAEAREIVGEIPTYISYDVDFVDPAFAPGTGTPEIGGPSSFQALEVVRHLAGLNLVGADLVEVSPPFDSSGGQRGSARLSCSNCYARSQRAPQSAAPMISSAFCAGVGGLREAIADPSISASQFPAVRSRPRPRCFDDMSVLPLAAQKSSPSVTSAMAHTRLARAQMALAAAAALTLSSGAPPARAKSDKLSSGRRA